MMREVTRIEWVGWGGKTGAYEGMTTIHSSSSPLSARSHARLKFVEGCEFDE